MLPTPGDALLVEQEGLDRLLAAAGQGAQRLGGEVGARAAPRRAASRSSRRSASVPEQHVAGAEAAHVHEQQALARRRAGCRRAGAAGPRRRSADSSRLPVMRRCITRWTSSSSEAIRYFPRRPTRSIARPRRASSIASGGAGSHQRGSQHPHALDRAGPRARGQLAANRLDLGELGHRPTGSSRRPLPSGDGRARVRLEVHVLEPLARQVGVELGGRDVGVAEHLLDGAQVAAAREQVGGEACGAACAGSSGRPGRRSARGGGRSCRGPGG